MDTPPVVSVVMPFLDVAAYLPEAIESVRAQTYPHWELLLVDDGATDGSAEIARRYAALDPERIRALEHPGRRHLGASASRNVALRHATGAYFAMLDGDDVWLPNKLEEQVALLAAHPTAGALCGSTEYWYSWSGRPEDAARDHVVRIGVRDGTLLPPPALLTAMLDEAVAVPCTCSLVVRRDAVTRAGWFEESFHGVYDDQVFYAKLFLDASLLVADTCWDRYRRHAASTCHTAKRTGEMAATRLRWLEWLRQYLVARDVRDPRLLGALRRARWRARHPRATRLLRRARRAIGLAHA